MFSKAYAMRYARGLLLLASRVPARHKSLPKPASRSRFPKSALAKVCNGEDQGEESGRRDRWLRDDPHHLAADQRETHSSLSRPRTHLFRSRHTEAGRDT